MVKRVMLSDLLSAAASDPLAINVDAKDRLRWALHTQGGQEVILVSASGQSIRFSEEDVRSMGLAAGGVGGMRLKRGDRVVSAHVVDPGGELATITELGYAKRTGLDQYSSQGRNGGGIVTHKVSSRTGKVAAAYLLPAQGVESLIVLQEKGDVKLVETEAVPQMGRGVMGKQDACSVRKPCGGVKAAAAALTAMTTLQRHRRADGCAVGSCACSGCGRQGRRSANCGAAIQPRQNRAIPQSAPRQARRPQSAPRQARRPQSALCPSPRLPLRRARRRGPRKPSRRSRNCL